MPGSGGYVTRIDGDGLSTPDILVAILSSVVSPDGVENKINTKCATGNCTFGEPITGSLKATAYSGNTVGTHSTVGVCSLCTDVVPLLATTTNVTTGFEQSVLPNGFNLTFERYVFAKIRSTPDLVWMGDLLTDDARAKSRWAYINATYIASRQDGIAASVCSLYPCLRTYNTTIKDNQLQEQELQSKVMQIELRDPQHWEFYFNRTISSNAVTNTMYNYTALQSPCRVAGRSLQQGDHLPNDIQVTTLRLYDFSKEQETAEDTTWPEQCVYRQDPRFVQTISRILQEDIFSGECQSYKGVGCYRTTEAESYNSGQLTSLGVETVLRKLIEGNVSHSNTTRYFNSVADAMTNRFRFQYGSAVKRKDDGDIQPLDVVYGTAWETKTCVQMHVKWLILPTFLTVITIILSVWTIITNFRRRYTIPVWKDSILPLLFYGHNIITEDTKVLAAPQFGKDADGDTETRLMEARAMAKASESIMVTFHWPNGAGKDGPEDYGFQSTTSLLGQEGILLRRRGSVGNSGVRGQ